MKPISEIAPAADSLVRFKGRALACLTQREHSQAELVQKLTRLGAVPDEIKLIVAELAERGLQSDVRFAEAWAQSRVRRGYGPAVIRQELQQRGIEAELITTTLEGLADEWPALARVALTKKFGQRPAGNDPKERARRWRFLRYRGFGGEALRLALGASADDDIPDEMD